MDWLLFIFKRENHHYLVSDESETNAWDQLCKRQSCRLDIAKKEYTLLSVLNGKQKIIKL